MRSSRPRIFLRRLAREGDIYPDTEGPRHARFGASASRSSHTQGEGGHPGAAAVALVAEHGLAAGARGDGRGRDQRWAAPVPQGPAPRLRRTCRGQRRPAQYALQVDGACVALGDGHLCRCLGRGTAGDRRADVVTPEAQ